jgi:hypothetical protein
MIRAGLYLFTPDLLFALAARAHRPSIIEHSSGETGRHWFHFYNQ